ncbi:oxidoreductase [Moniliophthora roreri]|nr:oxidoreductase [Moniliophthora roreri]
MHLEATDRIANETTLRTIQFPSPRGTLLTSKIEVELRPPK